MAKRPSFFNTLVILSVSIAIIIVSYVIRKPSGYSHVASLNFTEITAQHGYITEEHRVTTEDGYILTVFRIIQGKQCKEQKKKTPVILQHGLLISADTWTDSGPQSGLAYLISDACYDLWVPNSRGNYYSRRHVSLDPDKDSEFWHFSADEMGLYDVPAVIDHVLKYTGSEKVNYIGYSQGGGIYFEMCSERPGYCDKSNVLIALSPGTRQLNTKSTAFRLVMGVIANLSGILKRLGIEEILSKGAISQEFFASFCQLSFTGDICRIGRELFDGSHPGSITNEVNRNLFTHFPAGTSLQNIMRYNQILRSTDFVKFDYGEQGNLKHHGTISPPAYNLSAVSVPVVMIYGRGDGLIDVEDLKWVLGKLPNVKEVVEMPDQLWNHFDMCYSQYTKEFLFPKIDEYLSKYSDK